MSYIEDTLIKHCIVGTAHGVQGITQTVPEDSVLDLSCGWMRVSDYHHHLVSIVDQYIEDVV